MALVLTISQWIKGFEIYCDASKHSLATILMQHGKIVAYASYWLKDYEIHYPTYDIELAAVVFILKI